MERTWSKCSLGEEGAIGPQKAGERAQRPGFARPSGPGATLRGRSLAPWRLQPGCELGLRRTLLAARGRYSLSLCLSASAAAARRPALFRFPLLPNIASQAPTSHREGFCSSFPWGPWGLENRKERVREKKRLEQAEASIYRDYAPSCLQAPKRRCSHTRGLSPFGSPKRFFSG